MGRRAADARRVSARLREQFVRACAALVAAGRSRVVRSDARSLEVAWLSDVGRVRTNNEDVALVAPVSGPAGRYRLALVADGMGGGPRGELASHLAAETALSTVDGAAWQDPGVALRHAVEQANAAVYEANASAAGAPMGTTMVAALIEEATGSLVVANVGDSRAYQLCPGHARRITVDHSLVATRVAAGRMTEAEATVDPQRHLLLRGVGMAPKVEVDVFPPMALAHGERLLLCSDGLHGSIDDGEIEAGGSDNVTVVVAESTARRDPHGASA